MKKLISLALAAVLALGILSGCGKKADAAIQIAVPNDTTNEARALLLLEANGIIKLKDVAQRQDISKKYLEQIVPTLSRAGFLLTNRGYQGGYRLARRPEDYTARDILRLTEGSLAPVACLDCEVNTCPRSANCPTLPLWQGLDRVIEDYLAGVTLQDLIDRQRGHSGDDYVI